MPNLFITRDVARGYFWEAIPKVCPEAFDDLASLVDDYVGYLSKNVYPKDDQEDFAAPDLKLINERDGTSETTTVIFDSGYEEKGTIVEWQERWNLAGREERNWISLLAITNLSMWAAFADFHQRRGVVAAVPDTPRPVLQFPEIAIDQHETWPEFRDRAKQVFNETLVEYREAVKNVGAFQQNIRRDARWLAAHQVAGRSWAKVADSQDPDFDDPDPMDYTSVQRAANRFAAILPLTPRT